MGQGDGIADFPGSRRTYVLFRTLDLARIYCFEFHCGWLPSGSCQAPNCSHLVAVTSSFFCPGPGLRCMACNKATSILRCVMAVQCPPTLGQPRPWLLRLVPGYLMPLPEPDEARGALLPARSPSMILFYPAPSSTPRIIPLYRSRRCCAPPIFLLFSFAASDHALFTAQLAWLLTLF